MKQPPQATIRSELFPQGFEIYLAFCLVLIAGILYALYVGAAAVWPDSLYYADRARHLFAAGNFSGSGMYPPTAPLYALLMVAGFVFPDMESGHRILVILQALIVSSALFPLRALLSRGGGLNIRDTTVLAAAVLLLPNIFSFIPLLIPGVLLAALLIYGVYFLDRLLASSASKNDGLGAGAFLGLAWLTATSTGILWLAALAVLLPLFLKAGKEEQKRALLAAMVLPPALFIAGMLLSGSGLDADFSLNNLLARFNLSKNALIYLVYGGAPLAGLLLVMAGLLKGRDFWDRPFFRFAFITFVGLALYAALTTPVIVEKKLDYFTNRLMEPYLFLPLIVFFRLDPAWRKELLSNGMLVFFVLMIFGLPMALNIDFQSGLAFWNGGGARSGAGIIRNALYLAAVAVPVAILFWRPRWFVPAYTFLLFFMVAAGLSASAFVWSNNADVHIANAGSQKIYHDEALRGSDGIYVEYHCRGSENNDIAYLFRCYDLTRTLYFLPKLPKSVTAEGLLATPPKELSSTLFTSSETDNAFGPVVVQHGLARFQRVEGAGLRAAAGAPLVQVKKIKGMKQYITLPVMDRERRLTLLDAQSEMTLQSSKAGCVRLELEWFMDNSPQPVALRLNEGAVMKISVPVIGKGPKTPLSVRLNLPEGESLLQIRYGDPKNPPRTPSLIMFDRPVVRSCR